MADPELVLCLQVLRDHARLMGRAASSPPERDVWRQHHRALDAQIERLLKPPRVSSPPVIVSPR